MHEAPKPAASKKPEAKILAAGLSAAAVTLIIFIASLAGLEVPAEVAAAAVTVVAAVAGYLAPHTRREAP
jgi:putative flippase GtrA